MRSSGQHALFLDIDPHSGLVGGARWEDVIYARLEQARALVVVHTQGWRQSRWCFAEATHALVLGRPIIPVRFDEADLDDLLKRFHVIDGRTADFEQRLAGALAAAGLSRTSQTRPWPADRSPFRGLEALEAEDADALYGRDDEVARVVERLSLARRFGRGEIVVLAGPSGAGKSSLLRAGVLPRLRRAPADWRVTDIVRPGMSWTTAAARDASDGTGAAMPVTLIAIDQFEELLALPAPQRDAWLAQLSARLGRSQHGEHGASSLALATARTEALAGLQRAAEAAALALEPMLVAPLTREALRDAIEGPAGLAGIEFGANAPGSPGTLVDRILDDAGDGRALPLVSFTLRAMFERTQRPRRFDLDLYERRLGGLQGSVQSVMDAAFGTQGRPDDAVLKRLFIRLTRLDDGGDSVRRRVPIDTLPADLAPLIRSLLDARVLVSDAEGTRATIEVAHESMFREWHALRNWIDERREFLVWRNRFDHALDAWQVHGTPLGEGQLVELGRWRLEGLLDLDDAQRRFEAQSRASLREHGTALRVSTAVRLTAVILTAVVVWSSVAAWIIDATTHTDGGGPLRGFTLAMLSAAPIGALASLVAIGRGMRQPWLWAAAFFWSAFGVAGVVAGAGSVWGAAFVLPFGAGLACLVNAMLRQLRPDHAALEVPMAIARRTPRALRRKPRGAVRRVARPRAARGSDGAVRAAAWRASGDLAYGSRPVADGDARGGRLYDASRR